MPTLTYQSASLPDLREALLDITSKMNFTLKEAPAAHFFHSSLEEPFLGKMTDAVVKSYAALINKDRHYLLRVNYFAKRDCFQQFPFLGDHPEEILLEQARQKLPKHCQRHSDIKKYIQFFLSQMEAHHPFSARKMAITHGELHLFDRNALGSGCKIAGGYYLSGCLYPDLWVDGTLWEIKCYREPIPTASDLAQLLSYYALINHRLERNMEEESLIRAHTTLVLPKVEHLGFFFARQCSALLYPLKDIADEETWNKFASLYYYYLLKDRKGAKQSLIQLLSNFTVSPQ